MSFLNSINYQLLIPLLVTTFIAIIGWFITNYLSTSRDRKNKRQEQRIQYLIEAFRRIGMASNRPNLSEYAEILESAIGDIQLFGTLGQIKKAQAFGEKLACDNEANLNDLIYDLRQDLRKELRLPEVEGKIKWLRVKRK